MLVGLNETLEPIYEEIEHLVYDSSIEPTCLKSGLNLKTCLICLNELSNVKVNALGHDFGDLFNDKQHYQMCNRCMVFANYVDHSYNLGHDNKYHFEECSCGYQRSQEFHNYVDSVCSSCGFLCTHDKTMTTLGVIPSCTEEGTSDTVKCKSCGKIIKEATTLEKLPHEFIDGECIWCGEIEPYVNSCNKNNTIMFIIYFTIITSISLFIIKKN